LSDEVEILIEAPDEEVVVEVPIAESGIYMYVCEACGSDLTEIPLYNRFYCENCGLHY
jgi:rRNA maturation endonuclease Nob1